MFPTELMEYFMEKSKKDVSFTKKLGVLLDWTIKNPGKEDFSGIKQEGNRLLLKTDRISRLFQIQISSLKKNLKYCGFLVNEKQMISNEWISYSIPETFEQISFETIINRQKQKNINKSNEKHAHIQIVNQDHPIMLTTISLTDEIYRFWNKITLGKYQHEMPIKNFLIQTTNLFSSPGIQKEKLMKCLIRVLLMSIPGFITFHDFSRLLTNFGEKLTIGPKIISLIDQVGHLFKPLIYGKTFLDNSDNNNEKDDNSINIIYSDGIQFGFIIYGRNKSIEITNDYKIPFFNEYLVTKDSRFSSWNSLLAFYFPS